MFKNEFEFRDGYVVLFLKNKKLGIFECYIDGSSLDRFREYNHNWHIQWSNTTKSYYACATEYLGTFDGKPKYKSILMHRFICECEEGMTVDHLNYNTLDNRKENMRVISLLENNRNRQDKANNNSRTGVRNVSYSKSESKYIVQFQIERKNTKMASFDTLEEATEYANANRHKYYKNIGRVR